MIQHLFKLMWNQKRKNLGLQIEVFISFLVIFAVFTFTPIIPFLFIATLILSSKREREYYRPIAVAQREYRKAQREAARQKKLPDRD